MARLEIVGPNPIPGGGPVRLEADEKDNPSGLAMKGEVSTKESPIPGGGEKRLEVEEGSSS